MAERTTILSVDLDDLRCYHGIHGLAPPDASADAIVLERCLPRFLELFAELGVRATFFVVGRDLDRDLAGSGGGARWLGRALGEGHELGNHSHAHAYDLVRWSPQRIADDLGACDRLLRDRLGAPVLGFRAPGYLHDRSLLRQVAALGYRYDASALPSPPYYLAKLGILGAMALRGRRSLSTAARPAAFFGRRRPTLSSATGLWSVPISVTPGLRLPLIGTTVLAGRSWLQRRFFAAALRAELLHLELHAIDLLDEVGDRPGPELLRRQPELRTPLSVRRDRLRRLLSSRPPATSIAAAIESWTTRAGPPSSPGDRPLRSPDGLRAPGP